MKRVDRILREMRLCRLRRAGRAQGLCQESIDFDWIEEAGSVSGLLGDLGDLEMPSGVETVFDPTTLAGFISDAVDAVMEVIGEKRPDRVVADRVLAGVRQLLAPRPMHSDGESALGKAKERAPDQHFDPFDTRRGAALDVGALATQTALFEVIRVVVDKMDKTRKLAPTSDPASIAIGGGGAWRIKQPGGWRAGNGRSPWSIGSRNYQTAAPSNTEAHRGDSKREVPAITIAMREARARAKAENAKQDDKASPDRGEGHERG